MTASNQDWSAHFGIQNIPFGVASSSKHNTPQTVSRYGNSIIFLAELGESFLASVQLPQDVFLESTLNKFAALGGSVQQTVRGALQAMIKADSIPQHSIEDVSMVQMHLPVSVGDFTDFSCSEYHNLNASQAVTGRRGLPPTWGFIPPGYAGRCSSIAVSGSPVRRPKGQFWADAASAMKGENRSILYGPCKKMDYEMELGVIVGRPVPYGETMTAQEAENHIFGYVILNDWSARDIQTFEMIPLGPLNSKNSGTTMSPWVISPDAVAPFRGVSKTLFRNVAPNLVQSHDKVLAVDMKITVTRPMPEKEGEVVRDNTAEVMSRCNSSVMAWSFEQLIAYQSSAGCGLRSGDLLGIGTVSEEEDGTRGCLLEDNIPSLGRARGFVQDGETVELSGYCGEGVGFGDCRAQLLPASGDNVWTPINPSK
ncbi:hypothetical protein AAFC00_003928 [Neodothiora populina]|uniref:Fumarylacetoacetase n=1 Tax=Neodothiora populina TaxID=2781224 RepID=A0ABR3PGA7_9PEZI